MITGPMSSSGSSSGPSRGGMLSGPMTGNPAYNPPAVSATPAPTQQIKAPLPVQQQNNNPIGSFFGGLWNDIANSAPAKAIEGEFNWKAQTPTKGQVLPMENTGAKDYSVPGLQIALTPSNQPSATPTVTPQSLSQQEQYDKNVITPLDTINQQLGSQASSALYDFRPFGAPVYAPANENQSGNLQQLEKQDQTALQGNTFQRFNKDVGNTMTGLLNGATMGGFDVLTGNQAENPNAPQTPEQGTIKNISGILGSLGTGISPVELGKFVLIQNLYGQVIKGFTGHTSLADSLPKNAPPLLKLGIQGLEFLGQAYVTHGLSNKNLQGTFEDFTKQLNTEYNMPEVYTIDSTALRDIQNGGTQTPEKVQTAFKQLGLTSSERAAIAKGQSIDIQIPAEKLVTQVDKPWWSQMKQALHLPANEGKFISQEQAGAPTATTHIAGLLGPGEHTPQEVIDAVMQNKATDTEAGQALMKAAIDAKQQNMNVTLNAPTQADQVDTFVQQHQQIESLQKEAETLPKTQNSSDPNYQIKDILQKLSTPSETPGNPVTEEIFTTLSQAKDFQDFQTKVNELNQKFDNVLIDLHNDIQNGKITQESYQTAQESLTQRQTGEGESISQANTKERGQSLQNGSSQTIKTGKSVPENIGPSSESPEGQHSTQGSNESENTQGSNPNNNIPEANNTAGVRERLQPSNNVGDRATRLRESVEPKKLSFNSAQSRAIQSAFTAHLDHLFNTSANPEELTKGVKQLVESAMQAARGDKTVLAGMRTALNKVMFDFAGHSGNYKADYAMLQTLKDDPEIGPVIKSLEEHVQKVTDTMMEPSKPQEAPSNKIGTTQKGPVPSQEPVGMGKQKESTSYKKWVNSLIEADPERYEELKDGKVIYNTNKAIDDAQKAAALLEKDPQRAYNIAKGYENPPEGQTANAVAIALSKQAEAEGNYALQTDIEQSLSLRATREGQEIAALRGKNDDTSVHGLMQQLLKARLEALGRKGITGTIDKARGEAQMKAQTPKQRAIDKIDRETENLSKRMKSQQTKIKMAQDILDALTCK